MAFADWLLPLLLITTDDEHGRAPFDWAAQDALPVSPIAAPSATPQV